MLLPELQRLAAELGISGTARMRKGDLVAAISARQVGDTGAPAPRAEAQDDTGADRARGVAATAYERGRSGAARRIIRSVPRGDDDRAVLLLSRDG